jgi:hypothetical protein
VTSSTLQGTVVQRGPLERIVLPVSLLDQWNQVGCRTAWWVESDGTRCFLRARCDVDQISTDVQGLRAQLILHLNSEASERISWPGTRSGLTAITRTHGQFGIASLNPADEAVLEKTRSSVAATVPLPVAERRLLSLFARTRFCRPPTESPEPDLREAVSHARRYFARSDLVQLDGMNPFDVAAHVMSRVPFGGQGNRSLCSLMTPWNCLVHQPAVNDNRREMQPKYLAGSHLLELTSRHQEIVRALAEAVRLRGYTPNYNSRVDMAISAGATDILFEVKTASASTFSDQIRAAIGQLLEYRYRLVQAQNRAAVRLVAVLEATGDLAAEKFAREFLSSLDVQLLLWRGQEPGFEGLDPLFGNPSHSALPPLCF